MLMLATVHGTPEMFLWSGIGLGFFLLNNNPFISHCCHGCLSSLCLSGLISGSECQMLAPNIPQLTLSICFLSFTPKSIEKIIDLASGDTGDANPVRPQSLIYFMTSGFNVLILEFFNWHKLTKWGWKLTSSHRVSLTQKTLVFSMDFGAENNEIKKRTNLGAQFWDVWVNLRTSRIWRIIWRTIFIGVFSSLMWYIYVPSAFNTICPVLVVKPNFSQVQNIIPLFLSQTAVIKVSQSLTIKLKRGFCWRCRLNETIHLTFSWRSSNLNESPHPHPHPHPP